MRCLGNDFGRRLDSFSETVALRERVVALDRFSQKLLNSGHSLETVRNILVSGIKGYQRKVTRCKAARTPLHRSSGQSAVSRRTKKLLAKSNWFRSAKDEAETGEKSSQPWDGQPRGASVRGKHKPTRTNNPQRDKLSPSIKQELRTTTVLFVEFSKGGSLQKSMREVLDKLTPMLGFRVRVTERGGTTLGSLLSNKNLWSGEACGRGDCRPCKQPGDMKEPCTTKNIVYESECGVCNPVGSRKVADKLGLAEKREVPSLYVGETARSLKERSGEHWADAEGWKDESHMVEHQVMAHGGEENPSFNFKVVKHCSSSLERQVREAVRIQMRGLVLNKKGTYNRCKLTRLVVDTEWEDRVWRESWASREEPVADDKEWVEWEGEECLAVATKMKRPREEVKPAKRMKVAAEDGTTWGEAVSEEVAARNNFLHSSSQEMGVEDHRKAQTKIKVYSGLAWLCREIVKEVANTAATLAELAEGVAEWEEWQEEEEHQVSKRSEKEERYLWQRLNEIDKELAREEKRLKAKKARAVANARKKMGVGKEQPSILDSIRGRSDVLKPGGEGGGCVRAQTGSMSNIVKDEASQGSKNEVSLVRGRVASLGGDSDASLGATRLVKPVLEGGSCVHTQTGSMSNTVRNEVENHVEKSNSEVESSTCKKVDVEAEPNRVMEPAVPALIEKVKIKSKFEICTLPGGKFNLKLAKQPFAKHELSASFRQKRLEHNSDILVGRQYSARKVIRGENEGLQFNNIPVLNTPTKRKCEFSVINPASIFDGTSASMPGQHISESPAKRRRWGQGGSRQ